MAALPEWRNRISIDPSVHHGDPRVPVRVIVGSVADGDSSDQILKGYPQLTHQDIQTGLHFAAEAVSRIDAVLPRE
jgi:uncharacterized protein (DUF433 family)